MEYLARKKAEDHLKNALVWNVWLRWMRLIISLIAAEDALKLAEIFWVVPDVITEGRSKTTTITHDNVSQKSLLLDLVCHLHKKGESKGGVKGGHVSFLLMIQSLKVWLGIFGETKVGCQKWNKDLFIVVHVPNCIFLRIAKSALLSLWLFKMSLYLLQLSLWLCILNDNLSISF